MNKNILKSKNNLLEFLGIKENYLYGDFLNRYNPTTYKKKDGTPRKIKAPVKVLKKVQEKVLKGILCDVKQLPYVYGLSKDKGILNNAILHNRKNECVLLNVDVKDFYPSIKYKNVVAIFKRISFSEENSKILTKLCTIDKELPQGSPASAHIASLYMYETDRKLHEYCLERELVYSRYFDDITISGVFDFKEVLSVVKDQLCDVKLELKDSKTRFFKVDEVKMVNNLVLREFSVDVSDEYKKSIEEAYRAYSTTNTDSDKNVFWGKFGFYIYINKSEADKFKKQMDANGANNQLVQTKKRK